MGGLILGCVLVQPAFDIDERAFFQLHLLDTIDDRAKALYGIVEPSCVVLSLRIIDLLADAESDRCGRVITFGDTDGGFVVISSGNDYLGCEYYISSRISRVETEKIKKVPISTNVLTDTLKTLITVFGT